MLNGWRIRRAGKKEKSYSGEYQYTTHLRDGSTLRLRPINPSDDVNLLDLYTRLSPASLYHRFFTVPKPDPKYAKYLANADSEHHFALVAESDNQLIAVARFHRKPDTPHCAEAAFTVADAWQGKGLGRVLFNKLAEAAGERAITVFECQVAMDNERMLRLLSGAGFEFTKAVKDGFFLCTVLLKRTAGQARKSLIRKAGKF